MSLFVIAEKDWMRRPMLWTAIAIDDRSYGAIAWSSTQHYYTWAQITRLKRGSQIFVLVVNLLAVLPIIAVLVFLTMVAKWYAAGLWAVAILIFPFYLVSVIRLFNVIRGRGYRG